MAEEAGSRRRSAELRSKAMLGRVVSVDDASKSSCYSASVDVGSPSPVTFVSTKLDVCLKAGDFVAVAPCETACASMSENWVGAHAGVTWIICTEHQLGLCSQTDSTFVVAPGLGFEALGDRLVGSVQMPEVEPREMLVVPAWAITD